jgi:hypothetical protein
VKNLEEWFAVDYAYNSNAIEGNTLSSVKRRLLLKKALLLAEKHCVSILKQLVT